MISHHLYIPIQQLFSLNSVIKKTKRNCSLQKIVSGLVNLNKHFTDDLFLSDTASKLYGTPGLIMYLHHQNPAILP